MSELYIMALYSYLLHMLKYIFDIFFKISTYHSRHMVKISPFLYMFCYMLLFKQKFRIKKTFLEAGAGVTRP